MAKKIMFATYLLVASMSSQAAIISYNGYERDSASNIVKGGGLEWLKWDLTQGLSINQALATHAAAGWTLASNVQMASLFNAFQFGKSNWGADEQNFQGINIPWTRQENMTASFMFIQLFGYTTMLGAPEFHDEDPFIETFAFFGSDSNGNSKYNSAYIRDDFTTSDPRLWNGSASLESDVYNNDWHYQNSGIALVRDVKSVPPSQVSLPGSISLLALGLVALGIRRRQA